MRLISEFDLIYLALTGERDLVLQLIAKGQQGGRNCFRVFARCNNLFPLRGDEPGYWDAVDYVATNLAAAGCYFNPVLLVDLKDGNGSTLQSRDQARRFVNDWMIRYRDAASFLWAIVNEPEQPWQGFSGPTDPFLLEMAEVLQRELGHRDFIIGAAPDGDDPDASASTIAESREVAKWCNLIALHSSRKGGAEVQPDGRLRRWIDHLEGFVDVIAECRKVNPNSYGVHEEPMGHASQHWVPLGNGKMYEREYDPECAIAAAMTSEFCGLAYCYHYIRRQDAGTPGLKEIGLLCAQFPGGGDYRNDSWGGSPSNGFTWQGGKVRHYLFSNRAGDLAYGTQKGTVNWNDGYDPGVPLYDSPKCTVWKGTWV